MRPASRLNGWWSDYNPKFHSNLCEPTHTTENELDKDESWWHRNKLRYGSQDWRQSSKIGPNWTDPPKSLPPNVKPIAKLQEIKGKTRKSPQTNCSWSGLKRPQMSRTQLSEEQSETSRPSCLEISRVGDQALVARTMLTNGKEHRIQCSREQFLEHPFFKD